MSDNNTNQEKSEVQDIVYLYEIQPELIKAKSTLEQVLKKLCSDDKLMELIYKTSGDSSTTIIWYMQQVMKYLAIIIADNKNLINFMPGKF